MAVWPASLANMAACGQCGHWSAVWFAAADRIAVYEAVLPEGIRQSGSLTLNDVIAQEAPGIAGVRLRKHLGPERRRPDGVRLIQHQSSSLLEETHSHGERKADQDGEHAERRRLSGGDDGERAIRFLTAEPRADPLSRRRAGEQSRDAADRQDPDIEVVQPAGAHRLIRVKGASEASVLIA